MKGKNRGENPINYL